MRAAARSLPLPEMLLALLSPVRPVMGLRAFRALLDDPDDTGQVFRIIQALAGPHPAYMLWRFRHDPGGQRLLKERPTLLSHLVDRDALRAMPEGSLGRAYLAFCESEGITADGLVQASETAPLPLDPAESDLAYIHDRLRDAHDLWHTVTGYKGDLIGEAAILSFSFAQTFTPGLALIVSGGWHQLADFPDRAQVIRAFQVGRRTRRWIPGFEWEKWLERPLSEVREELGIEPVPQYSEVRTSMAEL